MKILLWLKYFLLVIFLILNTFLWAKIPPNEIKSHKIYKGVKFKISGSVIQEYNDLIAMINANPSAYPPDHLDHLDKPVDILYILIKRFDEMVASYNENKSKLPSCLSNGLDRFLKELAAGTKSLDIWWLKQKYPIWEEMIGNEDGSGEAVDATTIKIWTAYANRFIYIPPPSCKICEERPVLTESLLFHEMVHVVKMVYPECFKELKDLEELSADWAEVHIFGYKNSVTRYIDESGDKETDMCTYKIVCKCNCEDKSGRKFREQSNLDTDEGCEPDPPDEGPGGDQPDDNYSYFKGIIKEYNLAPEALIFTSGHWQEALKLFGGLEFDADNNAEKLLKITPFVIIPTGGLMFMQNDSTFKCILEQYVKLGGTVFVFAQQYGSHIENMVPIPEGESLKTYGWREDQSCLRDSIYFESIHPALSSSTNELINAGVDGYFSAYSSNSIFLLRRKVNLEPALLYYPYGNGMVILTSMFTDWASAHSQASTAELKVMRDVITFAKNPHLPIPTFDLSNNPTPAINLNVGVKNNTEFAASKAKLMVYTPNRNILIYDIEAPANLNQGESTKVAVNFTLPELQTKDYGICHVDYELYNAENELIHLSSESDSGRFSIYKITTPVTIKDGVYQWVTAKDENAYWGQDAQLTMHFKNTTNEPKSLSINRPFFDFGHGSIGSTFSSFTVNLSPGEQYDYMALLSTTQFPTYLKGSLSVRIQYYDDNNILKQIGAPKVIFLMGAMTESTLKLNGKENINQFFNPGGALNYEISSHNLSNPISGYSTIKLSIEKQINDGAGIPQNTEYTEIKTIYETPHDFLTNGNFHYSGVYTPQPLHPGGWYRFKLEVTAPNGLKETNRYNYLYYFQSGFNVGLGPINQEGKSFKYLIPGASYTIPIKITNPPINAFHTYDVKNGSFELLLESPTGQEVYRKEITGISIASRTEQSLSETFIFHPTEKGKYVLKYRYWDETKEKPSSFIPRQSLWDGTQISIQADKTGYNYQDTANIAVDIIGAGTYHLYFTCPEAGISEERNIQVPEDIYRLTQQFQVPIGLSSSYTANISVIDSALRETQKQFSFPRTPIAFDYQGNFETVEARAGSTLDFNAQIKILSGTNLPLNGQLVVISPQLNYQDTKDITLQPMIDNPFAYTIPIPADAATGLYAVNVSFKINNMDYITRQHTISLPPGKLEFSMPADSYNTGDTINLNLTNSGGKNGQFNIQAQLKDSFNKIVLQKQETKTIPAGNSDSFQLIIPTDCKSETYQLVLNSTETLTNIKSEQLFSISISGLTASLNAYTLKENYFDNETISGKAELTTSNSLENATLKAQIFRYIQSQGMEEETPGEFMPYNLIEKAVTSGNMMYFSSNKGIISYEKETGNISTLYSFASNIAFNSMAMMVSSTGELWIATAGKGIFRRDSAGQWINYPTNEVGSYLLRDIVEINTLSGTEIWAGGGNGISVFRNGQWVSYNTYDNPNGLISNDIYKFAIDSRGGIWVSTFAGLCRFNGSQFEAVPLPTLPGFPSGKKPLPGKLTAYSDGSIFVTASDSLYRFYYPFEGQEGQWQSWNFSDIYPAYPLDNYYPIYQLETLNGQLWLKFLARDPNNNNQTFNVLVRYNGNFNIYSEIEIPALKGLNTVPFIPGNGGSTNEESCYFTCEVGFLEYNLSSGNSGTWTHRMLEVDNHKLSGMIYCLTKDSQGWLWAGTTHGMSMFDGNMWHNYYRSTTGQLLLNVSILDTDAQDNIYGYSQYFRNIIKFDSTTNSVQLIPFPSGYGPSYSDRMSVENSGRIWLGRGPLYYYENGEWKPFNAIWPSYPYYWGTLNAITKDPSSEGGIWVSTREGYPGQVTRLFYIKDISIIQTFTSNNYLSPWVIERLYKDKDGKLWLRYATDYTGKYPLHSLDTANGNTWTNYSKYEGYPPKGAKNFVKDDNGRLLVIDPDYNHYALENNRFVFLCKNNSYINNSMVFINGTLYCSGGEPNVTSAYPYARNLLKVRFAGSLIEEEQWSQTYPINLSSGEKQNIDLLPNKTLPSGSYTLKTELLSSLGQTLAQNNYNFQVKATSETVSILLTPETPTINNSYIKPNEPRTFNITIQNNSAEDLSNLPYTLKKKSPSGVEEILKEQLLNLAAGQSFTDSFTFNENEIGTWYIMAAAGESWSNSFETLLEVTSPSVNMEINSPIYAGNDPFTININLKNEGKIETNIQIKEIKGTGENQVKIDENLILQPSEERLLSFNDSISADTNYTIIISGDVEKQETLTILYGYKENLNIDIQSTYREGTISIPYSISNAGNSGGLPFTDTLRFEIYNENASLPLYTFDKTYNLIPNQSPINDTLNFSLSPGTYQLKCQSIQIPSINQFGREQALPVPLSLPFTFAFTVLPAGIANVTLTSTSFPTGPNEIKYNITNTDSVSGLIPITISILDENTIPIFTETRTYFLQPNETQHDFISYNFPQKANYTLQISSPKIPNPINNPIQILNPDETSAAITIGTPETNSIPVNVDIANSGFNPFNGTLVIEASGIRSEIPITINPASSLKQTFPIETTSLNAGNNDIKVFLVNASGENISLSASTVTLTGPDINVSETPQNLEINAGDYADITLKLKNDGNLRGSARLKISAFDNLFQERDMTLEPGEEITINDISIEPPADCPTGNYPFNYTLSGPGVLNGLQTGNFTFKVNGIFLNVEASLDCSLYNIGETAQLTLVVTSPTQSNAPLEAMVNWGNYSEKKSFVLSLASGSTSLTFEIPLDEKRQEKVFYGIYHEDGKAIYLNDIYLYFKDKISVETDKQVYAPGDIIHAVFTLTSSEPSGSGTITVEAFGESQTLPLSSSASATFQVPPETLGGTYAINWHFVPSINSQEELSGSHSFDVSGLVVKVAKAELEKGSYAPGETIKAAYIFESNRDDILALRSWISTPSDDWTYLGESNVSVSAAKQTNAISSYSFNTTEAGTHELVYGLYKDNNLVVSGRLAFDAGNAALIGIATDKPEYQEGNENVIVGIDYLGLTKVFGGVGTFFQKGSDLPEAKLLNQSFYLELFLDNEKVAEQNLTISGLGHIDITLNSTTISGGSHQLKAILTADATNGLTSTKTTGFLYGTNLPDLTLLLTGNNNEGLNYTYQVTVSNRGKTTNSATTLAFSDNNNLVELKPTEHTEDTEKKFGINNISIETIPIPTLAPGTSQEITIHWSGSGKAGHHEFLFEIDPTNTVKEYSEGNNSLTIEEDVPFIFYNLEVEPLIWYANTDINIITRLINNQNQIAPLTLNLSIVNAGTGASIFQRTHTEELPAFGSKSLNDPFNTGIIPAGQYTLSQDVTGTSSDTINLHKEIPVLIEVTKTINGNLQLLPFKISSGIDSDVELSMNLKNTGNVSLEEETLTINVINKESKESVKTDSLLFSIPLGQEIPLKKTIVLNLTEGQYEIRLKYPDKDNNDDNIIASAELTALPPIKPEKTIAIRSRVSIMNLPPQATPNTQNKNMESLGFLSNLLQNAEIKMEAAQGIDESYFKFHKGYANINVVIGEPQARKFRDELKERVWRGEGLILICNNPFNAPDMSEWLGVSAKVIVSDFETMSSKKEGPEAMQGGVGRRPIWPSETKVITVLPGDLSGLGGQMELIESNRLILEKKSNDVVIIGQTQANQQEKQPVITYRKYGNGHILVIATPIAPSAFKYGNEIISQMLLNAVNRFSNDIYTISTLTRILPVEISLTNEGSEKKDLIVKEILPYGVEGYDFQPALDKTGTEDEDEIKWKIKVPGGSTEIISYWLRCPDQAGTFEIKTEIYEGETKLEEVSLNVEVSQTVHSRILDLITELEALDVSGKDVNAIRQAKNFLEAILNRSTGSLTDHLMNLQDAVQATETIGHVKTIDISLLRLKMGDIMVIMGRRFYEAVNNQRQ